MNSSPSTKWVYHSYFIHSPLRGQVGYVQLLSITIKAAMTTGTRLHVGIYFPCWGVGGQYLAVEWLGHRVGVCLNF